MLRVSLFCVTYLLVFAFDSVDARVVDANIASLPTSDISSLKFSESANITASAQSCTDINTCRTLNQIVVSCFTTILACVWFAVHRNIPEPKVKQPRHANFFVRSVKSVWRTILNQREAVIVFVVALLAPEWILAWALRQALTARTLCRKLEEAREEATERRCRRDPTWVDSDDAAGEIAGSVKGHSSFDGSAASLRDLENIPLTGIRRRLNPPKYDVICEECEGHGSQCDQVAAAKRLGKADECWDTSHAFLAIMGGFYFHNGNKPLHPLSPAHVIELVQRGHLVPPTADEISNQSKGDALSKGIAIVQTLWFVVQCIARSAEGLPVTSLEVMTLAYTVMTIAMYIAWWDKPLNVSCAVRVLEEQVEEEDISQYKSVWERVFNYVMGNQDSYVDVRQCTRVPTFWAGEVDGNSFVAADMISLLVAMVFGAVHCIAWSSELQSHLERQLWRVSAIAIIAVPVAIAVVTVAAVLIFGNVSEATVNILSGALFTLIAIIYIAARLILIVISFTSLKRLPAGALHTVQWTTLIPHI